eukprot:1958131-Prymnesium_polylepis.1
MGVIGRRARVRHRSRFRNGWTVRRLRRLQRRAPMVAEAVGALEVACPSVPHEERRRARRHRVRCVRPDRESRARRQH